MSDRETSSLQMGFTVGHDKSNTGMPNQHERTQTPSELNVRQKRLTIYADNSELKLESYNEDSMLPQGNLESQVDRTIFPYGYERKGEMSIDEMKAYIARKTQSAKDD